jgi:putative modified peptide
MPNTPKPLPGKVVAHLLDKLSNDDAFRALFQKNPAEALKQVGAPEPENGALCLKVEKLADKASIKASREALIVSLTGTLDLHLPQLIAR